MKNFPFEYGGQTYWYSRSVACSLYLFIYVKNTKQWYILVSQRGPGCPSNINKWNVPGGYLDFDETPGEAARRECFEETGIRYDGPLVLASVSTNIHSNAQNVVMSFYGTLVVDCLDDIRSKIDVGHCEDGEVLDVDFWRAEFFFECFDYSHQLMAFGQDDLIREIYKERINLGPIRRWLVKMARKLLTINTYVE